MKHKPEKNPFFEMFQKHYDDLQAQAKGNILQLIEDLVKIDDDEIIEIFANELGNTWMMYSDKLKGKTKKIGAICLKWNGYVEPGDVPTLVFSDAYESYAIEHISEKSHIAGLADSKEKIYASANFHNKIFEELGGFDIDFVTNYLLDADDDVFDSPEFEKLKMLYTVKILDLTYRSVILNIAADRFQRLPKNIPFAFFAFPIKESKPILICEIEESERVH